jgi:hypothetical protein
MGTQKQLDLRLLYNDARMAALFDALDELHNAASDNSVQEVTPLSNAELAGWLRELVYTAQETIDELEYADSEVPGLRLVPKIVD